MCRGGLCEDGCVGECVKWVGPPATAVRKCTLLCIKQEMHLARCPPAAVSCFVCPAIYMYVLRCKRAAFFVCVLLCMSLCVRAQVSLVSHSMLC